MAVMKRSALGRGLDALITMDDLKTGGSSSISEIELSKIQPNPDQPRSIFEEETLEELASLEKEGRIHIIRPSSPIQAAMIERDESNLERIYQTGRADMKKDLEKLKAYLDS